MKWFRNLNITTKLLLSGGIVLVFTGLIAIFSARCLTQQASDENLFLSKDAESSISIDELRAMRDQFLHAQDTANPLPYPTAALPKSQLPPSQPDKQVDELLSKVSRRIRLIAALVNDPLIKKEADSVLEMLPTYEKQYRSLKELQTSGQADNQSLLGEESRFVAHLTVLAVELEKLRVANLQEARSKQEKSLAERKAMLLILFGLALPTAMTISFFVGRSFVTRLKAAASFMDEVTKGKLHQRLATDSNDELGVLAMSLNCAVESMDRALLEVGHSALILHSSSQQLSHAAQSLSTGAQEHASSFIETSASIGEITAIVRQNSANAKRASQLAISSTDSAVKGGTSAEETMAAMSEIKASSAKIAEIITTIDEIAFQTNLLSVNASVEAARAGIHGNGFKVVAAEIRNLALRSAASAKEIKLLIQGSVRKVEKGSSLATNSSSTLKEIVGSVKRVSDIVGEIATASAEQAIGIEQVGRTMGQMDRVTQANSSQTDALSTTATLLLRQSSHLEQLVSCFQLSGVVAQNTSMDQSISVLTQRECRLSEENSIDGDGIKNDPGVNLQSMARNVGHSVLNKKYHSEVDEF